MYLMVVVRRAGRKTLNTLRYNLSGSVLGDILPAFCSTSTVDILHQSKSDAVTWCVHSAEEQRN
jgi:hypothetical protein